MIYEPAAREGPPDTVRDAGAIPGWCTRTCGPPPLDEYRGPKCPGGWDRLPVVALMNRATTHELSIHHHVVSDTSGRDPESQRTKESQS